MGLTTGVWGKEVKYLTCNNFLTSVLSQNIVFVVCEIYRASIENSFSFKQNRQN